MATTDLKGAYFVKNTQNGNFVDVTNAFNGVRILAVEGVAAKGKAVNVYNAQWMDSQTEDFMVTSNNGIIIRENVDIEVTFIVHNRYASSTIDVKQMHDQFVDYMTRKEVWIKTNYQNGVIAHCVALEGYEPTTMKLQRGNQSSFALGTIKLHCIDAIEEPT